MGEAKRKKTVQAGSGQSKTARFFYLMKKISNYDRGEILKFAMNRKQKLNKGKIYISL